MNDFGIDSAEQRHSIKKVRKVISTRVYFSEFSTVIPCLNIEVSFRNSFDRPKKNPLLVIERPLGDQKSSMADMAIEMLKKRLYIAFYKWIFASLDISGIIHSLNVCHFIT